MPAMIPAVNKYEAWSSFIKKQNRLWFGSLLNYHLLFQIIVYLGIMFNSSAIDLLTNVEYLIL